jgi:antimicrobial peptide system SdpA family protein
MFNRLKFIFIISIFTWAFLLTYLFINSLPETIIHLNQLSKIRTTSTVPEGWAFFTKNPRDENIVIYKKSGASWRPVTNKTGDYLNFFGLKRTSRFENQEMGILLASLDTTNWVSIKGGLEKNFLLFDTIPITQILNSSHYPYYKEGEYILVQEGILPWVWFSTNPNLKLDSRVRKIKIQTEW